jgi:hypothetical protein
MFCGFSLDEPFKELSSQVKADCVAGILEFLRATYAPCHLCASYQGSQAKDFLIRTMESQKTNRDVMFLTELAELELSHHFSAIKACFIH